MQVMMRPSTYVFISYICLLIPNIGVTNFLPTILNSVSIRRGLCKIPADHNSFCTTQPIDQMSSRLPCSLCAMPSGRGMETGRERECGTSSFQSLSPFPATLSTHTAGRSSHLVDCTRLPSMVSSAWRETQSRSIVSDCRLRSMFPRQHDLNLTTCCFDISKYDPVRGV